MTQIILQSPAERLVQDWKPGSEGDATTSNPYYRAAYSSNPKENDALTERVASTEVMNKFPAFVFSAGTEQAPVQTHPVLPTAEPGKDVSVKRSDGRPKSGDNDLPRLPCADESGKIGLPPPPPPLGIQSICAAMNKVLSRLTGSDAKEDAETIKRLFTSGFVLRSGSSFSG